MKKFKVEGWYRLEDYKDFELLHIDCKTLEKAVKLFKQYYSDVYFYKITVEEIE